MSDSAQAGGKGAGRPAGAAPKAGPRRPPLSGLQVLVVLVLGLVLLVMLDFTRRQGEARRLEADRDQLSTEVAQLGAAQAALETQVAYATTDAAVVAWAHEHGKLVQGDEVLVVPVIPTVVLTPPPPVVVAPPVQPNWTLWWGLFFDAPAPVSR